MSQTDTPPPPPDEPPTSPRTGGDADWIDRASAWAGKLGANPVRVRWKLQRWVNERDKKRRAREQRTAQLKWDHKLCPDPQCGAINDKQDKACSRCGARLGSAAMQTIRRLGIVPAGVSASALLGIAMVAVYGRMVLASSGGGLTSMEPLVLVTHGANFRPLLAAEPWRLLTAVFLHSGVWHIGFNLYALTVVGPFVENVYSRSALVVVFALTGFAGSVASAVVGGGFSVGASGAIMGLIGVIVGEAQRAGTEAALERRNAMLRWVVLITVFGLFIGGIDHAGHFGGLIAGGLFGYVVRPRAWVRARPAVRQALTAVGAIALAGAVIAALVPLSSGLIAIQ